MAPPTNTNLTMVRAKRPNGVGLGAYDVELVRRLVRSESVPRRPGQLHRIRHICTQNLKCSDDIISKKAAFVNDVFDNFRGDVMSAWGGISSRQFGRSLVWTESKRRGFDLLDLNKFLSRGPARLAGLHDRKGKIEV